MGNNVLQVTLENGTKCWSFRSSQYVQSAVKNVEEYCDKQGLGMLPKVKSPWPRNYRPKVDISTELSSIQASYYQSLIGMICWIVELGRPGIVMETSALASMMAFPREGRLDAVFHMFAFLKRNHNGVIVFDSTEPEIDIYKFSHEDWSANPYGECTEEIPSITPEHRGIAFRLIEFVDSDHAGNMITQRSRTGFLIFLNNAPINWFTKKKGICETSSFGLEFISMKSCCDYVRVLWYKLRMLVIPVEIPTYIFGDNQSVLVNSSNPHSSLMEK